ncbi:DUF3631 domain-containing protein [Streptomyces aurantiacus]
MPAATALPQPATPPTAPPRSLAHALSATATQSATGDRPLTCPVAEVAAVAAPTGQGPQASVPPDIWEPLLAVTNTAGGTWPERARAALVARFCT